MSDVVLLDQDGGRLFVTMNRPDQRNALNVELCEALVDVLRSASTDPSVRVLVLRGSGSAFCVGGDVKAFASGAGRDAVAEDRAGLLRARMEAARLLHDMPKPTVAAINGSAAGAGLSLALACDFRIATPTAKMTTAFAKVGLSGDYGGSYFLTKLLGSARARELYLLSPVLSGAEAHAIGLVTRLAEEGELDGAVDALVSSLLALPRLTLGYIKQNLNDAEHGTLPECMDREAQRHTRCSDTADHREAAAAFVAKRAPVFVGR